MNPLGARKAIQEWLADIKAKKEQEAVEQQLMTAYGRTSTKKAAIENMFDGEPESPDWIDLRRMQNSSHGYGAG